MITHDGKEPCILFRVVNHSRVMDKVFLPFDGKQLLPISLIAMNVVNFRSIVIKAKLDLQAERTTVNLKIAKRLLLFPEPHQLDHPPKGVRAPDAALLFYTPLGLFAPGLFDTHSVTMQVRVERVTRRKEDFILGLDFLKSHKISPRDIEPGRHGVLIKITNPQVKHTP